MGEAAALGPEPKGSPPGDQSRAEGVGLVKICLLVCHLKPLIWED